MGLCRTVAMTIAHPTHGVCTVVDALLRPRRFHSRCSAWLYPALCTFASSLVIAPIVGLGPAAGAESEPLPSSVLSLNQTRAGLPWFAAFPAAFESTLNAGSERRFSVPRHYQEQISAFAAQFEFIDLIGLPMTEIRKRAAVLPDDTAIIYTGLMDEGPGPHEGLAAFGTVANRPIVIDAETSIGDGGTGGFVATPVPIDQATERIALRVLDGEAASKIPVVRGDFTRPVFDWRQLQRFGISESGLQAGSEVHFREFSLWEQYCWQTAAIFLQTALIGWLLFERHRRRFVEMKLRARLLEVIHLNRTATAGALSASVAHELNQPLGAIQSYAEAATLYLQADP